jgi:hypothetical protein
VCWVSLWKCSSCFSCLACRRTLSALSLHFKSAYSSPPGLQYSSTPQFNTHPHSEASIYLGVGHASCCTRTAYSSRTLYAGLEAHGSHPSLGACSTRTKYNYMYHVPWTRTTLTSPDGTIRDNERYAVVGEGSPSASLIRCVSRSPDERLRLKDKADGLTRQTCKVT